jgi:hypothetical protein
MNCTNSMRWSICALMDFPLTVRDRLVLIVVAPPVMQIFRANRECVGRTRSVRFE